jgi:hypothetical protein
LTSSPSITLPLQVGGLSWAEVAESFLKRATKVGNFGWINTTFKDNLRAQELNLPGRMYNLVNPETMDGMTTFGLPKILQELFRIGMPMANMDHMSAHFQSAKELAQSWGKTANDYPNIFAVAADRKAYQHAVAIAGMTEDDMKTLLISIAYLCARSNNWPAPLQALHDEFNSMVQELAHRQPDQLAKVRTWGKQRPAVTLFSYYLCHFERIDIERMVEAAGDSAMTPEFDGLVLFTTPDGHGLLEACDRVRAASRRPLSLKPYAKTFEEWLQHARARYPEEDWGLKSKIPWTQLRDAVASMDYYLSPPVDENDKPKKVKLPLTDLARIIAADLEPTTVVSRGKGVCWHFNGTKWEIIDTTTTFHRLVKDSIHAKFRTGPFNVAQKHGKFTITRKGFPLAFTSDHGVLTSARIEAASDLVGIVGELDVHRHFLGFRNGKTLDLRTLKLIDTHPSMRISRVLQWDGELWETPELMAYRKVVADIIEHWKTAERPDIQDILKCSDGGDAEVLHPGQAELVTRFKACCKSIPYLQVRLKACGNDVDKCIYKEQWMCRQISAMQHLCEMLYTFGPPGSGKDVDALFTQEFFGPELTGTIATTDVVKLPGQAERGVDASTPTMTALNKCRVALVAEVPEGVFAWHRLKHYVEQQGIRAHSRGHSSNPDAQNPTFALLLWSNYIANMGNPPPEGAIRRTAIVTLDARYGKKESEEDGQFVSDIQLKYNIQRGDYRLQQLWTALAWLPALWSYPTSIPKPACIVANCEAALPNPLKLWAADTLKECKSGESMTTNELKKLTSFVVGFTERNPQLVVALRAAGFSLDVPINSGKKRGVKFVFPEKDTAVFVKLK